MSIELVWWGPLGHATTASAGASKRSKRIGGMLSQLIQQSRESAATYKTKIYDVNVTERPDRQRAVDWKTLQCCEEAQNGGNESFG